MNEANLATGLSGLQLAGITFFGFVVIAIVITAYGHSRRRKQQQRGQKKEPAETKQVEEEKDISWEDIIGQARMS